MKWQSRSLVLLVMLLVPACGERKAQVDAPVTHRSNGISFDYPKNWKVTEDSVEAGVHHLFIESPGNAIAIVQSFPPDGVDKLADRARAFSSASEAETPVGEIASEGIAALAERNGFERVSEKFSITLLGEKVPHRRTFAVKQAGGAVLFVVLQVAEEDFAKVEAGFDLILDTLERAKAP